MKMFDYQTIHFRIAGKDKWACQSQGTRFTQRAVLLGCSARAMPGQNIHACFSSNM